MTFLNEVTTMVAAGIGRMWDLPSHERTLRRASSGNVDMTGFFSYDPSVHLVGQTSGTVWLIDAARTHPMFHDNVHGAGESIEGSDNEYYTNASGAQLHLRSNYHLTVTGQGRVAWVAF